MELSKDELRILIELVSKVQLTPGQPNAVALTILTVGLLNKLQEELAKDDNNVRPNNS